MACPSGGFVGERPARASERKLAPGMILDRCSSGAGAEPDFAGPWVFREALRLVVAGAQVIDGGLSRLAYA